jgi:hypothetical protein
MRIEELDRALEKAALVHGSRHVLAGPASEAEIRGFEARVNGAAPPQVAMFYRHCNGLSVAAPKVDVFPIEDLHRKEPGLVPFCRFDGRHELSFDVRQRNAADEWTIINADTGFQVTLTLASFLFNKLFAWVKKQRPIWGPESWPADSE